MAALWMAGWLALMLLITVAGREALHEINVFQLILIRSSVGLILLYPLIHRAGGFAAMRGTAVGESSWDGRVVPPGLRGCRVEGDYYPGASYVCRGESLAGGSAALLLPGYRELVQDVGYCLEQPIWYPRLWRQGQDFEFAGGERQTIWRDGGSGPKPTVALKIEEDLAGRFYYLRFAVASDR